MPFPPLFVYGTLRDPDVLSLVLGHAVEPARRNAATAADHEVVFFPGRTYPAIRTMPGAIAPGTLVEGLEAADLATLDAFEGDEYFRRRIEIIVNGTAQSADVYWPSLPIGRAPLWLFEEWTARHKAHFLAAEASSIAEWRAQLSRLSP